MLFLWNSHRIFLNPAPKKWVVYWFILVCLFLSVHNNFFVLVFYTTQRRCLKFSTLCLGMPYGEIYFWTNLNINFLLNVYLAYFVYSHQRGSITNEHWFTDILHISIHLAYLMWLVEFSFRFWTELIMIYMYKLTQESAMFYRFLYLRVKYALI